MNNRNISDKKIVFKNMKGGNQQGMLVTSSQCLEFNQKCLISHFYLPLPANKRHLTIFQIFDF